MGRKDKTAPASSSKALEVCGKLSNLGLSAADVFEQWSDPAVAAGDFVPAAVAASGVATEEPSQLEDVELATSMQLLRKKDPKSRLRGVTELREALLQRPPECLKDPCSKFLNLYDTMWLEEADPKVREGLQRCLHVFVEKLQKDFTKYLRRAFPTWLCAMFDCHPESAQAARQAFRANFTTDQRRRNVFLLCQAECLKLFEKNLQHSEQSLHQSIGVATTVAAGDRNTLLERQDRYIRVIVSTLSGLAELGVVNSAVLSSSDVASFFATGSSSSLWTRLSSSQPPLIRRAAAEALVRLLQSPIFSSEWASTNHRSAVLGTLADEGIPAAVAAALVCAYSDAGGEPCWEGLNAPKALWPNLLVAVKRGAGREAAFLERLPSLVGKLPSAAARTGKCEAVLSALLEALKVPRALSKEVWSAYFGVVAAASSSEMPLSAVFRWLPVKLYLGIQVHDSSTDASEPLVAATSVPASSLAEVPKSLELWLPKLLAEEEATAEYLDLLSGCGQELPMHSPTSWTRLAQLLQPLMISSSESTASTVRSLLAAAASRLFTTLAMEDETTALNATRCLAALLSTAEAATVSRDWAPLAEKNLQRVPELSDYKEQASNCQAMPVLSLLAWPLLPLWADSIKQKQVAKATALGGDIIRPLIQLFFAGSADKDSAASQVRDLLVGAALAEGSQQMGTAVLLTHIFQAATPEVRVGLHPSISKAVEDMVASTVVAVGQESEDAVEEATLSTIRAAMLPGKLSPETQCSCLQQLLGARSLRLALACKDAILSKEFELQAAQEVKPLRSQLLQVALLQVLSKDEDSGNGPMKEEAWQNLPGIMASLDLATVTSKLGAPPKETDEAVCLRTWLLALQTAAKTLKVPWVAALASSLAEDRAQSGSSTSFSFAHLERRAAAIAEAFLQNAADAEWLQSLEAEKDDGDSHRGLDTRTSAASLMWELFLAEGLQLGGSSVSSAAVVLRQRLRRLSWQSRHFFLTTCLARAAEEGSSSSWSLSAAEVEQKDEATATLSQQSPTLYGLGVLRSLLEVLVSAPAASHDAATSQETYLVEDLSRSALEVASGTVAAAAAYLSAAAVVQRQLELGSAPPLRSIDYWRGRLREAAQEKTLSAPLLVLVAQLEVSATAISSAQAIPATYKEGTQGRSLAQEQVEEEEEEDGAGSDSDDSDEIIIVRKPPASSAAETLLQENTSVVPGKRGEAAKELPELDTSVLDLQEQLLRWAQSGSDAEFCSRGDVFALYVWSTFGSFAAASSEPLQLSSRSVVRLHRLLQELFKTSHRKRSLPGALRLVSALASRALWPASNWPVVMEALIAAGGGAGGAGGGGSLTLQDAAVAAAGIVPHLPSTHVTALVPFLGAECHELREAVLARLRKHSWLAADLLQGPTTTFGKLKELLEDDDEEMESGLLQAPTQGASTNDIAFATLSEALGKELVSEAWNVEEVMGDLLSWEVQASQDDEDEEEDESEEEQESEDAEVEENGGRGATRPDANSGVATQGIMSLKAAMLPRRRHRSNRAAQLPASLGRRCCVTLGAWESMLQCFSQGPSTNPSVSSSRPTPAATTDGVGKFGTPSEIAVAALQISPDQLTRKVAKAFFSQRGIAPSKEAEPPLKPLFQLVCQLLSSSSSLTMALLRDSDLFDPDTFEDSSAVERASLLQQTLDRHITHALASNTATAGAGSGTVTLAGESSSSSSSSSSRPLSRTMEADLVEMAARLMLLSARTLPAALRKFWERLPRQRDRKFVAQLVSRSFSPPVARMEVAAAQAMLDDQQDEFPDIRATVVKRADLLVLMMQRDEHKMELQLTLPKEFPLLVANPKIPEKMVAIPVPRVKNWMRQAKPVLAGRHPCVIGRTMTTLAKSVSLYFDGVEDCPICYSLLHVATQTLPKKACPTCKKKFHNECLYRWWKSSAKTTCPLCNQPF